MGQRLQRGLSGESALAAGQWCSVGARRVVACPQCSKRTDIGDTYDVGRDGTVTPIFACPNASCSFTDYLSLESIGDEHVRRLSK